MIWREVHVDEKMELSADFFDGGQAFLEEGVVQVALRQLEDERVGSVDRAADGAAAQCCKMHEKM
jgi:hypothetical protein